MLSQCNLFILMRVVMVLLSVDITVATRCNAQGVFDRGGMQFGQTGHFWSVVTPLSTIRQPQIDRSSGQYTATNLQSLQLVQHSIELPRVMPRALQPRAVPSQARYNNELDKPIADAITTAPADANKSSKPCVDNNSGSSQSSRDQDNVCEHGEQSSRELNLEQPAAQILQFAVARNIILLTVMVKCQVISGL